jgi:hypothetical protein
MSLNADDAITKPTLQTVLDRINLRADFREFKSQFKSSTGLQN